MKAEDLKCCGNCKEFELCFYGNKLRCNVLDKEKHFNELCDLWEHDNKTEAERSI
jgi:hypothetical protein